ncbi:hypothetical protein [Catellatospora sp. NPDC049609]|uniref:hypothetical protein n=1 Tax=Catellatospora sp. NPDC049609 TaxID=3155505 RepID=UPI00341B373F
MTRLLTAATVVTATVVTLATTACTSPAPTPPRTTPTAQALPSSPSPAPFPDDGVPRIPCDHVIGIEHNGPQPPLETLLDAVALPTRVQLQPVPSDGRWWAKHGLLVRPGAPVDIEIVGDAARHATIGWGNPGPETTRIRVHCPANPTTPGWLAFAGGYTVDEPTCLPLRIRSGPHSTLTHIPIGTPC